MQIIMSIVTYNFTNEHELIENVDKNTFNDYDINDLCNIELLCDNYALSIDPVFKYNVFIICNIDEVIYSLEANKRDKLTDELIIEVIDKKISFKFALRIIKSVLRQRIARYKFNHNILNTEMGETKMSYIREYTLYFHDGRILSINYISFFSGYNSESVKKIRIVTRKYTCTFKNNSLKLIHNKSIIQYSNNNLTHESVIALIRTIEANIDEIIAAHKN